MWPRWQLDLDSRPRPAALVGRDCLGYRKIVNIMETKPLLRGKRYPIIWHSTTANLPEATTRLDSARVSTAWVGRAQFVPDLAPDRRIRYDTGLLGAGHIRRSSDDHLSEALVRQESPVTTDGSEARASTAHWSKTAISICRQAAPTVIGESTKIRPAARGWSP